VTSGGKERRQPPTRRCVGVNAVDKGVSGRFGVKAADKGLAAQIGVLLGLARGKKAVDKGVTALDEGGNVGWAEGSGWEMKAEQKWTVGGSCGDGMRAGEVRRAAGRGIDVNVGVEDSRRGTRGQLVGGTVEVQLADHSRYEPTRPVDRLSRLPIVPAMVRG
jgi:hypothetical protein